MRGQASARGGFSLLELVAILLLLGVLAVVIVPGMTNIGAGPAAEAERLRTNLRYAQSLAIANNTASWGVQFNAGSYQLLRNGTPVASSWPGDSGAGHIVADGVRITAGAGLLEFDDLGAPAATRTIVFTAGGRSEAVTIIGFTGLIP